jgi:hypothetical protein
MFRIFIFIAFSRRRSPAGIRNQARYVLLFTSWPLAGRGVAEPIDPFEPRAVAEVKARHDA